MRLSRQGRGVTRVVGRDGRRLLALPEECGSVDKVVAWPGRLVETVGAFLH
jgi:hypothetical protein